MKTLDYPNFAASIKAAGINPSDCNAVLSHMNGLLSEESRNSLGLLIISAPDLNRLKNIIKFFACGYFGLGAAPFGLIHEFACIFAQVEKASAKA